MAKTKKPDTHTHRTRTGGHCATILISPLQVPLLRVDKKEIEATTLASLTLRQGVLASISIKQLNTSGSFFQILSTFRFFKRNHTIRGHGRTRQSKYTGLFS